jgi:glycine/D-amino acid oxidase-like deaminating enzyme
VASRVVIGGGVNGLSVAWGMAEQGADVVVLDRGRIGSGAWGIAGGIVRNPYRAEAITEVVRRSEMFEEEPEADGFHQVGYLAPGALDAGRRPLAHTRAARVGRLRVRARKGMRCASRE